jgi:hypothetical protein
MLARRAPAHLLVPAFVAALASVATIGADLRWLAALGATISHGSVPRQLPFATASTTGWHDVPVLAELTLHWFDAALGEAGLVLVQVLAVAGGFAALVVGLRRASTPAAALIVGALAVIGCLPDVLIVRGQLFSVLLLPVLLLVLDRSPQRLWIVLPLLAIWSNLHGSVLVGLALVELHVLLARRDAWRVAVLAPFAVCATTQLWHTPAYYWGVSQNVAAKQGVGVWAPLGTSVADLLVVCVALALAAVAVAGRRSWRLWEAVAAAGLVAATVHAARFGTWLVLVLTYPAARALAPARPRTVPAVALAIPLVAAVLGIALARHSHGGRHAARAAATGAPVLAETIPAEEVELAGGRIWVADPIDAFRTRDQRTYLDWLRGRPGGREAVAHASLVLVVDGSAAARAAARDPRLARVAAQDGDTLYRVTAKARR